MARQIGPGNPGEIPVLNIPEKEINLDVFDKIGDAKIKQATQNFELYASTTLKAETQKLYEQYHDNPMALASALEKLPSMFDELPEGLRNKYTQRLFADSVSLVSKARANQEKAIAKQNNQMARMGMALSMDQISEDFFNVMTYITAPDAEKRDIDMDIYNSHRQELMALSNMTDEDGKPLFSETERSKMLMPKEAQVAGFKQFINRMEHDQLKEWTQNIFQDQTRFMNMTGTDEDVYETMDGLVLKRLRDLQDTKQRVLHGQAYYDAAHLITEPTALNIEKAKASGIVPEKLINNLVEQSKKTTAATYYDPTKRTGPGAFVGALNQFATAVKDNDWSDEGRIQTLETAANTLTYLDAVAKESNMDPKKVDEIKQSVFKAITDRNAQEVLMGSGVLDLIQQAQTAADAFAEVPEKTIKKGFLPAIGSAIQTFRPIATDAAQQFSTMTGYKGAQKQAVERLEANLEYAFALYMAGQYDEFYNHVQAADRQYKKDQLSFMISPSDWRRIEYALAENKPAVINYMGRTFEFKGFDNAGPLIVERI